jgi:hypothetical protein
VEVMKMTEDQSNQLMKRLLARKLTVEQALTRFVDWLNENPQKATPIIYKHLMTPEDYEEFEELAKVAIIIKENLCPLPGQKPQEPF